MDSSLALLRFRAAFPHIRSGARVCDIGCGVEAHFLRWARSRIGLGVGLEIQRYSSGAKAAHVIHADITKGLPLRDSSFDHAVMLAVLEHLPEPTPTLRETFRILKRGGSLVLTYPSEMVDPFLKVLHRARLIGDEMQSEEHQHRLPMGTLLTCLRDIGFERIVHRSFEFGLNNLLVAHKLEPYPPVGHATPAERTIR